MPSHPSKTIVFVHGNFVTAKCWDGWAARYRDRGYQTLQIEYPLRDKPVAELRRIHPDPALGQLGLPEVLEHHIAILEALPEKPILMGHSFGGMLTQLLANRDLHAAAVAIDSVPVPGVLSFEWSFLRSLWPVVNPLHSSSEPYLMTLDEFRYTFANNMEEPEVRAAYDELVVPESRLLARGALTSYAKVDFAKERAPLLFIAGEVDHIMPASLNKTNFEKYKKSPSITDFHMFPNRAHMILGQTGWQEVADFALDWAERVQKQA